MALFEKKSTSKKVASVQGSSLADMKTKETLVYRTLIRPQLTEKSHVLLLLNQYVFRVERHADKGAVRRAVEALYGVHVEQVRIISVPKQKRIFRGRKGSVSGYKKAIVTVREGETIEVFQGV